MEGGVRHRLLGVVRTQEKNRLQSACTQVTDVARFALGNGHRPAGGHWAIANRGPVPERVSAEGRACQTGGLWRSVGAVEGSGGISSRSRDDVPNARTDGP